MTPSIFFRKSDLWRITAVALALLSLPACLSQDDDSTDTTDTTTTTSTPENPPAGVVDDSAGFYVQAQANSNYTYITHRGSESGTTGPTYGGGFAWGTACKAALGDDVMCYIEADELDLWFNGLVIQHNVPSTMCSYVAISLPWYFKLPAGIGGNSVQNTI